jgi:hypothetical protein
MLNEISQAQKDKCYMISYVKSKIFGFMEVVSKMVVTRGWGE